MAFPWGVLGPVLFWAFLRLASARAEVLVVGAEREMAGIGVTRLGARLDDFPMGGAYFPPDATIVAKGETVPRFGNF
ncbi:MAG: hypothetical protein NVSMB9_11190 [Isosphaeraceae bacterium]